MNKSFFRCKWILLFFLSVQFFFLNSPAHAEWTAVDPPTVSSDWELFNIRFSWAVGQDYENRTGVLLYFFNGSWIPATLSDVSSDWMLSGVDLTSPSKGWAVGQDFENKRGVLVYFANPVVANLPTVTTIPVTNITETTATGGGNVTSDGGTEVTARGVCWGTSADPTEGGTCTNDGTGTGVFTSSITGLTPATLYHVRAYATNSVGTAYGSDLTFTTTVSPLPTVTTTAPSNITPTTATGGGNVTSAGSAPVTAKGVCWSTLANPTIIGSTCTSDGIGTGVFTSSITGLTPSTLYHVRAYATNSVDTAYGSDLTFSTIAATAASAATTTISKITTEAAANSGSNLIWPLGSVIPPDVSSDWGLSAVTFVSSDLGWAVGQDYENRKGVILLYSEGTWISVIPPNVSSDWGLSAVHFTWAVGQDWENGRGVILYFSGSSWTSIIPPEVSSNWGLSAVRFLSSHEAWAVGRDIENGRGVLLHFLNGSWTSVSPPDVSSDWGLSSIDFISPNEAWTVGQDFENGRAVLLHYLNHSWTSVSPPDVSSDWGLSDIHLMSPTRGWAVGQTSDGSSLKGVLLKYTVPKISVFPTTIDYYDVEIGALLEKTVTVKNIGNGDLVIDTVTSPALPFSISMDSCSGRSLAWLQTCKITYRFLPDSAGIFWSNSNILSNGSDQNPVTVTLTGFGKDGTSNYIHLLGPPSDGTFTACHYSYPPVFEWEASGSFISIEIQFSLEDNFSKIPLKIKGDPDVNQLIIGSNVWKRILLLPGTNGGTIYWRVIAKKKDKTRVESDVFSFVSGPPGPVMNPEMSHTSKTTAPPPTLWWDNNCNMIFNVWFGNDPDFRNPYRKKILLSFRVKSLEEIQETFTRELTPGQWYSIRRLGGDITGATLYWYVQSLDTLGRRQSTDVMSFVLTE